MFSCLIFLKTLIRLLLSSELIESTMYMYQATKDPYYLEIGRDILESIERHTRTPCGYATVSSYIVTYTKSEGGKKRNELDRAGNQLLDG